MKRSREADGCLFLVMLLVLTIVALALLVSVLLARPAHAQGILRDMSMQDVQQPH